MTMFSEHMTADMISDFKKWSKAIGGDYVMKGVKPDITKYIQLGFGKEFINEMEYSWVNSDMFYDPIVEDPEFD